MEIELKQFRDGKPVGKPADNIEEGDIVGRVRQLKRQKKFEEALSLAKQMEGLNGRLTQAEILSHLQRWKELIECCDKGLQLQSHSEFYHLKGKALGKLGNHQEKVKLIAKAIELKPGVAVYERNIGAAYYALKQYEQAISHHLNAVEIEPQNPINYHNLGSAYFRMGQPEKALLEFDKAIQKNPKQALSHSWRGDSLRELGRLEESLQSYKKAYDLTHSAVYLKEVEKVEQMIREAS